MNLFELFAVLKLNKDEYEKGLTEAEGNANNAGSKIGAAMATTAKAVAVGIGSAATAAGALVKQSVDAYASYEQLVGGVDTLFGTGGQSIVEWAKTVGGSAEEAYNSYSKAQAAQATVMDNAANAYKTAGMSANEYMETVTSFSAALIASLDGDTQAAADKADKAITDMSDNANKMGTSMESIQNAYQGFAKQNYTMLDNLKLGYGGTKEEMQRLLDDAAKLSGVEYDISSYSDIVDAIHVVQDEMGITGTTAKEASTTIEGSLNSMKAAWENVITGLGNGDADLSGLISELVDSAATFGQNLIPVVEQSISGVGQLITELLPVVVDEIPTIVNDILPDLINSGIEMINSILTGITENAATLAEGATEIIETLVNGIGDMGPTLIESAVGIIEELANGLAESLPELIPQAVDIILEIVDTMLDNIDTLVDTAITLITALAEGLIKALPKLAAKAPEIIVKLVSAIVENLPKILQAGVDIIGQLASGLIEAIPTLVASIPDIVNSLVYGFADLWDSITGIGKNIVDGLWSGISGAWETLKNNVSGLVDGLVGGIKDLLGIHSPSRVFAGIGGFMAEGLGVGWDKNIDAVINDINDSLDFSSISPTLNLDTDINGGAIVASESLPTNDFYSNSAYNDLLSDILEAIGDMTSDVTSTINETINDIKLTVDGREFARIVRAVR